MGKKPKSKKTAAAASARRIEGRTKEDENEDETMITIHNVSPFPESDCYIKAQSCLLKGILYKFNKLLFQGSKKGCTYCLNMYAESLLYSVDDLIANNGNPGYELLMNRKNIHLTFPLFLESAIRGSGRSIILIHNIICIACSKSWKNATMNATNIYWQKYYDKHGWTCGTEKSTRKETKTWIGKLCHGCNKAESDTVTLKKCSRCNFYFYCSSECQKKMWLTGGHAGECRQLAILKQYHRPHGKHIRDSLVNGVDPKDIPELQELRRQLGLDRPKAEYEDLLQQVKSGRIEPCDLIVPNKDGTVQIGSFPRPM